MAQAGLLLPSEPLFIVDKTWNLQGANKRVGRNGLDLFSREDFKVSKAGQLQRPGSKHMNIKQSHTAQSQTVSSTGGLQFIAASEPGGRQDTSAKRAVRKHARQLVNQSQAKETKARPNKSPHVTVLCSFEPEAIEPDGVTQIRKFEDTLGAIVPVSSWALYGNDHARDPIGLENYFHYYRFIIAHNAYPLENYIKFGFNPIRGTCFPLALSDRLFLQTIMLISAIHHSHVNAIVEPKLTDALTCRVLKELRSRIAQKDVSDATLLSVSCIALVENLLGHHGQWRVHARGMHEMLRLRGGVGNIDISIRWKLYRADLVGAVDHVSKPLLPHPGIKANLQDLNTGVEGPGDDFAAPWASSGISIELGAIFRHISRVMGVFKNDIQKDIPLSVCFYDNSCLQIQHDLLDLSTYNVLDESWRIAGLVLMNTFTKARPFAGPNCVVLSQNLRASFGSALRLLRNKDQHLWLAFIGGLVSLETSDHLWFLNKLNHIVQVCGCVTWEDAKDSLSQVLWLDVLHDEAGNRLWREISAINTSPHHNIG